MYVVVLCFCCCSNKYFKVKGKLNLISVFYDAGVAQPSMVLYLRVGCSIAPILKLVLCSTVCMNLRVGH